MSYATMDHAAWAEGAIAAGKRMLAASRARKTRSDNTKGYAAAPDTLSEFQAKVMDILGMVGGGIYNAPIAWDAIQWIGWGQGMAVPWHEGNSFATFDGDRLTKLVFLCHEARIRCEIRTHAPRMFLLCFWPRLAEGRLGERHPNLDEAVAAFRDYLPADHRVVHRVTSAHPVPEAA
ncbi:hypothetical protein [Azospirillum canadense]|uniref:hypothetical protein n=1 Tax=Azospirillum canadense TaxID=403962 RepID=UPI002227CEB0|nr:hypothetical protein [Azospirillum canadense]MCW2242314.1 hypothetical protein [Azospirillum canadense]